MGELAVFHEAANAHVRFGADAIPQCIISMCKGISDMLEVALLLKEAGLVDPTGRVGEQDDSTAQLREQSHAEHCARRCVSFVDVRAPLQASNGHSRHATQTHVARVTDHQHGHSSSHIPVGWCNRMRRR